MEEIDLKELIETLLEKKVLIILVVVIFALLGAIYTLKFITPKYQSSTSLVLVQTGSENNNYGTNNSITTTDVTLNSKLVDNYSEILKSTIVAFEVKDNLGLDDLSVEQVKKSISVSSKTDTEILWVTVENVNPERACDIANEVAKVFQEKVTEMYKVNNVHVLDVAEVSDKPANINLIKNIIVFSFIGAIIVFAYIMLTSMMDSTIKTDTDIERITGLPVLASIMMTSSEMSKRNNKKDKKASDENDLNDAITQKGQKKHKKS